MCVHTCLILNFYHNFSLFPFCSLAIFLVLSLSYSTKLDVIPRRNGGYSSELSGHVDVVLTIVTPPSSWATQLSSYVYSHPTIFVCFIRRVSRCERSKNEERNSISHAWTYIYVLSSFPFSQYIHLHYILIYNIQLFLLPFSCSLHTRTHKHMCKSIYTNTMKLSNVV